MGDVEELIERLREGVTQLGLAEDNCIELFDVTDADEVMYEAADALASLQARLAAFEAERDALRAYVDDVARQWLPTEPEPFDDFDPSYEDAYAIIVSKARALKEQPHG